jgi:hypothetical protein
MESHRTTASAEAASELDLAAFPAQEGRSLVDVVIARMRSGLASVASDSNHPLLVVVAIGAVIGTGLGLILI